MFWGLIFLLGLPQKKQESICFFLLKARTRLFGVVKKAQVGRHTGGSPVRRYMELLEGGEHQLAYEFLHQRLKPLGGLSFASEAELKDLCFGLISRPEVVLRDWDRGVW